MYTFSAGRCPRTRRCHSFPHYLTRSLAIAVTHTLDKQSDVDLTGRYVRSTRCFAVAVIQNSFIQMVISIDNVRLTSTRTVVLGRSDDPVNFACTNLHNLNTSIYPSYRSSRTYSSVLIDHRISRLNVHDWVEWKDSRSENEDKKEETYPRSKRL